jgi:hypothetical protein
VYHLHQLIGGGIRQVSGFVGEADCGQPDADRGDFAAFGQVFQVGDDGSRLGRQGREAAPVAELLEVAQGRVVSSLCVRCLAGSDVMQCLFGERLGFPGRNDGLAHELALHSISLCRSLVFFRGIDHWPQARRVE